MTDGEARRLALGGLIAMAAAMGIGRFVLTPILPAMLSGLGWSKLEGGLVASANFAGYLAGALGAGLPLLAERRRLVLAVALFVCATTTGAMGLVSSLEALGALRFIAGAASAIVLISASALVLERLGASGKSRFAAMHFAGVGIGIAISAALVASLASSGYDWRWLWLASGAALLIGTVLAPLLVSAEPQQVRTPVKSGRGVSAIRLTVAYGLFGFGYIVTTTFLVALVRETAEIRPLEPWIWLIVGVAAAPSATLWQALGRRIGLLRAFAVAALAEAVGVAASVE
ncbi:MAG: YbfB/YjiJ family MFS transporter, partial [Proteobacteria bacterium]|nr:YbfB/YjiJ family MFS transporter [Pseudomonadota bacterium]